MEKGHEGLGGRGEALVWHGDLTKRKRSGGKKKAQRTKRRYEAGRHAMETELGPPERRRERVWGGGVKVKLASGDLVNVSDPATGLTDRVKILGVIRNPADIDLDRRGILTRGTIVRTEKGLARIVSRPGQSGVINAVIHTEGGGASHRGR